MKNIVVLNGSPHEKGCTSALSEVVIASAAQQGAEVKSFYLNAINIRGCQGCFKCKETGHCAIIDDMQPIYDALLEADGLILASPVYMWAMSAQLKAAVDRLFAFFRPGQERILKSDIKVLLLFTQGQKDVDMFRHYFEHVGKNMQFMNFGAYKILVAGGTHTPEQVLKQLDVIQQAEDMGKWLSE